MKAARTWKQVLRHTRERLRQTLHEAQAARAGPTVRHIINVAIRVNPGIALNAGHDGALHRATVRQSGRIVQRGIERDNHAS